MHTALGNLTIPRVQAWLSPGGGEVPDELILALELSDDYGDPVVDVSLTLPWRRPRPFVCEVTWPPKRFTRQRFRWRR